MAQTPNPFGPNVVTYEAGATTQGGNVSTTISTTSFIQLLAANPARRGVLIQNNGTHNMYVAEGMTVTVSTTTNSFLLPFTTGFNVWVGVYGGSALTGQINISCAASTANAFYAVAW